MVSPSLIPSLAFSRVSQAFFFLLWWSEIVAICEATFKLFALKAEGLLVLDSSNYPTLSAANAWSVHRIDDQSNRQPEDTNVASLRTPGSMPGIRCTTAADSTTNPFYVDPSRCEREHSRLPVAHFNAPPLQRNQGSDVKT
ncbi:hypothetical protein PC118_g22506 [Phytophthora cactorum]|uniref:Uncharacterized protein n=1 Tax=Phytophthora cactorum TaxID=29920 RepID=A0A8T1F3E8_9STRA|nr:hypothetical protein PC111_g19783 [Phytophthora cactorum]KAG2960459.1 hypothetical protein PC118_g22506 [Phytophthora cactorum]KAG2966456.1 hypothetical protein PC119_g24711 [Phytophthora cactorum]KAG3131679.1 hypothetical protein C6341_g23239 [Phytophthora cactorum]